MILLTRLSGETVLINEQTILYAQQQQNSDSTRVRVVIGDVYEDLYVVQTPYTIYCLARDNK